MIVFQISPAPSYAGGGCGVTSPEISASIVKPGQSFHVDFSFIQNDSDIDYASETNFPEINFSSSSTFLSQKMQFRGFDSNKWALYRANFQIPPDFSGNMNLQAVLSYPACEGNTRAITYGPFLTIQSDGSIPSCSIQDLQVTDYSVRVGETFKVGFTVYSPLQNLNPVIELTDARSIRVIQTRLSGVSGTDIKVYEATLSYQQAYQYIYGAIARAVVNGLCNSSGTRQIIGTSAYVTSMALLQPIYPNLDCLVEGSSVATITNRGKAEELYCEKNPERNNTLNWLASKPTQKAELAESCSKLYSIKAVAGQKSYCIYRSGSLVWAAEKTIKLAEWQEASSVQDAKMNSFFIQVNKLKKSDPQKTDQLEALSRSLNESVNSVPESIRDTFEAFLYQNNQVEKYLAELSSLTVSLASKQDLPLSKAATIRCVKGKLTKKISGINPKCPAGYKKK
jgi:hypothetical protein